MRMRPNADRASPRWANQSRSRPCAAARQASASPWRKGVRRASTTARQCADSRAGSCARPAGSACTAQPLASARLRARASPAATHENGRGRAAGYWPPPQNHTALRVGRPAASRAALKGSLARSICASLKMAGHFSRRPPSGSMPKGFRPTASSRGTVLGISPAGTRTYQRSAHGATNSRPSTAKKSLSSARASSVSSGARDSTVASWRTRAFLVTRWCTGSARSQWPSCGPPSAASVSAATGACLSRPHWRSSHALPVPASRMPSARAIQDSSPGRRSERIASGASAGGSRSGTSRVSGMAGNRG